MARKWVLTIDLDIPEMQMHSDLAQQLRKVADSVMIAVIIRDPPIGNVIAQNGNIIGSFGIKEA